MNEQLHPRGEAATHNAEWQRVPGWCLNKRQGQNRCCRKALGLNWTLVIQKNTEFGMDQPQPYLWHIWHLLCGWSARWHMNLHWFHQHADHVFVPGPHPAGRGEKFYQQGSDLPELQRGGRENKSACRDLRYGGNTCHVRSGGLAAQTMKGMHE